MPIKPMPKPVVGGQVPDIMRSVQQDKAIRAAREQTAMQERGATQRAGIAARTQQAVSAQRVGGQERMQVRALEQQEQMEDAKAAREIRATEENRQFLRQMAEQRERWNQQRTQRDREYDEARRKKDLETLEKIDERSEQLLEDYGDMMDYNQDVGLGFVISQMQMYAKRESDDAKAQQTLENTIKTQQNKQGALEASRQVIQRSLRGSRDLQDLSVDVPLWETEELPEGQAGPPVPAGLGRRLSEESARYGMSAMTVRGLNKELAVLGFTGDKSVTLQVLSPTGIRRLENLIKSEAIGPGQLSQLYEFTREAKKLFKERLGEQQPKWRKDVLNNLVDRMRIAQQAMESLSSGEVDPAIRRVWNEAFSASLGVTAAPLIEASRTSAGRFDYKALADGIQQSLLLPAPELRTETMRKKLSKRQVRQQRMLEMIQGLAGIGGVRQPGPGYEVGPEED